MMEISVKVQIELSDSTKQFLAPLLGLKEVQGVVQSENSKATKTEPVKTEPVKTEPVKTEPVKTTTTKATPVVKLTVDEVRAKAAPFIENYRSEIKEELKKHGATSITALDPSKYELFVEFLKTLKAE